MEQPVSPKSQNSKMIAELYHSWLGIPGTEDKGAIESLKQIEAHLKTLNGSVRTNTTWRKMHTWVIGIITTLVVAILCILLSTPIIIT